MDGLLYSYTVPERETTGDTVWVILRKRSFFK